MRFAMRTTLPAGTARLRTGAPGELVGTQTTRSGMSVTTSGRVIRPASEATTTGSPSAAPIAAAVAADRCSRGCFAGAGEMRLAVLQPAGVEQPVPGGEHRLAGPRSGQRRRGDGRGRRPLAIPAAERGDLAAGVRDVGEPQVEPHLGGQRVQHPAVGQRRGRGESARAISNGRGRPSQSRKVPAFSTAAATGSTTSAGAVTASGAAPG